MRTKLNCLFAAAIAVGCGGASNEAPPPGAGNNPGSPKPVVCATPPAVQPSNATPDARLQGGRTFTISVQASDPKGGPLSFEWRSTDGRVNDVNAATTTWKAPDGPGLHFVYVLVKNGKGGYTERRVAISTEDANGTPPAVVAPINYAP